MKGADPVLKAIFSSVAFRRNSVSGAHSVLSCPFASKSPLLIQPCFFRREQANKKPVPVETPVGNYA